MNARKHDAEHEHSHLLELVFRGGRRHSEEVVQLGVDDVGHGVPSREGGRRAGGRTKEDKPAVVVVAAAAVEAALPGFRL